MVWGRSHAKRACPPRGADVAEFEAPAAPPIAQCSRCESSVVMAGGKLPKGWAERDGEVLCPDDAALTQPTTRRRTRCVETRVRHVAIGTPGTRYGGCRISHEFAAGFVGLRIHAGYRAPREGRDDPVNFMLDAAALDQLIIELASIRRGMRNG